MTEIVGRTLCFILALNGLSYSQEAKPISIEDALKAREFAEGREGSWPELSPDGKWVAYLTVDRVRESHGAKGGRLDQGSTADIWVTSTESGETISVTKGIGTNEAPSWSPDGKHLAFFSDRDGSDSSKVWLWEMASRQLHRVSDAPALLGNDTPPQWLPDSRFLLVALKPEEGAANNSTKESVATPQMIVSEPRVPGSTVTIFRSSEIESVADASAWNLSSRLCDLAVIDASDGAVRRIAKGLAAYKISVSPDGTHVAVAIAVRFERKASQQILYDIRSIDVRTSETRTLAAQVRLSILGREFAWSPDNSAVAYCVSGQEEHTGDCFIVKIQAKEPPLNVTNFASRNVNWVRASLPAWRADASQLYYIHEDALWASSVKDAKARKVAELPNHHLEQLLITRKETLWVNGRSAVVLTRDSENQQSGFFGIDLDTGSYHLLLERGQNYSRAVPPHNLSLSDDGQVLAFVAEDVDLSPDIWVADQVFRNPKRVSHLNPDLEQYQMGKGQAVSWNSLDGQPLHGALLLPAGYREGQKYPLIVWVSAGSNYSFFLHHFGLSGLNFNFQLLASRGYAVLMPDAPEQVGTPMTDLVKTVLPGVEKVIQMGVADPSRLGVAGHSRGGYTALSLIVQTNRFKAAMMADGFGDLISQYGELQDDGIAFQPTTIERRLGGSPWQVRDRYIENSPLFYLDRVETPLLIIHGMDDRNVFPNRSDEVFVGLRRLGKEVVYARYAAETHAPTSWIYANQLDFWTRVITWFDDHLKKSEDKKPARKE